MKRLFAAAALVFAACEALADDDACNADIKIYRVLAGISGPVQVAGAAAGAGKEEAAILTLSCLIANPSTLTVGGLELKLQGSEARWGNAPEPNRPDIVLLSDTKGIEFKDEATVTLSESPASGNGKPATDIEGFRLFCRHGQGRGVRVFASLERAGKSAPSDAGPKHSPAPETLWQSTVISPDPDTWACLIFGVATPSGKSAGSILVLLKTHGAGFTDKEPKERRPEYAIEMKFVQMPASTAELFRSKYQRIGDVTVTPQNAELFRVGVEEQAASGAAKGSQPSLMNWLNDQDHTELLSAPRITLAPPMDGTPPKPKEPWCKLVIRDRPGTSDTLDVAGICDDLTSNLRKFAPRLSSFLEEHSDKKPGIVAELSTEYGYDKERGRVVRDLYGAVAGVALKPVSGDDAVQTGIYWNMKNRHESKRGLKFWKKPAPPTFTEFPAETTLLVHDRECFGVLRPYEPADMWLLCTVCVTKQN